MKTNNQTKGVFMKILSVMTALMLSLLLAPAAQAHEGHDHTKINATQMAVRDLWVDHIFWIRSVVVADVEKDKQAEAEADKQVVENARKIAGVIEPFYGKAASDKLFVLLAGHYGAVKDYMNATIPKADAKKQKEAVSKLTANATEIAAFLSGANPNLPQGTLVALLAAHGGHHVAQIDQLQKKNYAAEAETWSAMKQHMYTLSDALVNGIAKQFPDKF
jgi:hypothetical protein